MSGSGIVASGDAFGLCCQIRYDFLYQLRRRFDTEDRRRDTHRWILQELRQHTEAVTQRVALALDLKDIGMPPDPDSSSPDAVNERGSQCD
ncbi:hypothetical protein GCM10010331_44340 [Streptomyces xanthochromogenes]|nr:hypothetical protein GCM10010331_44340 [Streptomyces xanthochromogenes]